LLIFKKLTITVILIFTSLNFGHLNPVIGCELCDRML